MLAPRATSAVSGTGTIATTGKLSAEGMSHVDDVGKKAADGMSPEDAVRYISNNEKAFFNEFSERARAAGLNSAQIEEAFIVMKTGDYTKMATYFDTSSPVDGAVFWSGNKEGAATYANGAEGMATYAHPSGYERKVWLNIEKPILEEKDIIIQEVIIDAK